MVLLGRELSPQLSEHALVGVDPVDIGSTVEGLQEDPSRAHAHLQDRVGLPLVAKRFGGEAYVQFSIEEWMGASPIYSLRMQRAMGFEDRDVSVVFKNLQLDIGSPHQFMDFQFRLDRPEYGEFWLPHCGALLTPSS